MHVLSGVSHKAYEATWNKARCIKSFSMRGTQGILLKSEFALLVALYRISSLLIFVTLTDSENWQYNCCYEFL